MSALALVWTLVLGWASPVAVAAPLYTVLDLGQGVQGTDLNNSGQVVGNLNVGGMDRAFVTGPNGLGMSVLPTLGGPQSRAYGINAAGQVVGMSFLTDDIRDGPYHAVVWGSGRLDMTDLGTLTQHGPSSVALDINDEGRIVGRSDITPTEYRSFLTGPQGVGMSIFEIPGFVTSTSASRINGSGQVAGTYNESGDGYAFITGADAQGFHRVATDAVVRGINERGMVSGSTPLASSLWTVAFVTEPNGSNLRTIWPTASDAYDINNFGLAVGEFYLYPEVTRHAFVYGLVEGTLVDLNTLVDLPGVVLNEAVAINDAGQILVNSGNGRAYLLTPVPEPAALAMLAAGLGLVLVRVRLNQCRP